MHRQHVVVIGGGVTGLVAARAIAAHPEFQVTVLEAGDRAGGQLASIEAPGGALVDVGAESVHLGAPKVAALVGELGLRDSVVAATPGASLLKVGRRLAPLPAGVGPTGPTKVAPVLRSGILSVRGLIRAGMEPLFCRKFSGDISVGAFVGHRFGQEVAEKFVDPLLGNLHSGNIHGLSLKATAPALVPVARDGVSLLKRALSGQAGAPASSGPMFASWHRGLTTLTDALAAQSQANVLTGVTVSGLERVGDRWLVHGSRGVLEADQVVVAVGVSPMSQLVSDHCPEVGMALAAVRTATVATVVLGFARSAATNSALRDHNGLLLTSNQARTVKAMTNLSRKWPTRLGDAEHHLIRVSVGSAQKSTVDSMDDQTMVDRCIEELDELIGLQARPEFSRVVRWSRAMPQLAPGHLDRMARARNALATVPGLHVAGAAVDGLGIGNTVASGQRIADAITG